MAKKKNKVFTVSFKLTDICGTQNCTLSTAKALKNEIKLKIESRENLRVTAMKVEKEGNNR